MHRPRLLNVTAPPAATAAPLHDDDVLHITGYLQSLIDWLGLAIPRSLCGIRLSADDDTPELDPDAPVCPRCQTIAGPRATTHFLPVRTTTRADRREQRRTSAPAPAAPADDDVLLGHRVRRTERWLAALGLRLPRTRCGRLLFPDPDLLGSHALTCAQCMALVSHA